MICWSAYGRWQFEQQIYQQYKLQERSHSAQQSMFKQLEKMWGIQQESNESKTEEQLPQGISQETKHKLKLIRIGAEEEEPQHELDLDAYLQTQRANTKGKVRVKPKTAEELEKEKQFREGYGKGFKMLQKMGFNVNKGLGKNEQGRTNIVQAEFKTSLTTRDEDLEEQQQIKRRQQQREQEQKQKINPYNQNQFEELFLYKSRSPVINNLLLSLKNKYEINRGRLEVMEKQCQSFSRDLQISESLKVQKHNQVKQIDAEIEGLQHIGRSTAGIERFPHLAITYNADLLIVKQAIQRLQPISLSKLGPLLTQEISKARKTLNQLYLQKQKQSLKQYRQMTVFQERMQKLLQKPQNFLPEEDVIAVSEQDKQKIAKYLKLIVEETVIKNKLELYFSNLQTIEQCETFVIDLMETIGTCSAQLCSEIKDKYLIKLVNGYLRSWGVASKGKKLPHLVVFPWLMVISLEQMDVNSFLFNVMNKMWSIETDELYNLVAPWLKHIKKDLKQYFLHLYLAPRLLFEMENLNLESPSSKDKIKGFLKYSQLLSVQLRQEIIENSLALKILNKYQKQLKTDPSQAKDLRIWAIKWVQKFDKMCNGAIQRVFIENGITDIW